MRKSLIALLFLAFCPLLIAQQALNNDSIVKLVKAGLSDDLIVTTINASPGTFDTSANGLIALKQAGASDKVISAILSKSAGTTPAAATSAPAPTPAPASAPGLPAGIDDVGVYYKDSTGAWVLMLPEIVYFESSGKLKNIASAGIVKGDLNGRIDGPRSRLNATFPVTFAVYLPENVEITEYQLLRLHTSVDSREFLSASGGVLHTTAGATRDAIGFQPQKLAPRLYQITLTASAGSGEYGLLAPGTNTGSNKGASGKIYTVSVYQ
jgi:hypothetical protein